MGAPPPYPRPYPRIASRCSGRGPNSPAPSQHRSVAWDYSDRSCGRNPGRCSRRYSAPFDGGIVVRIGGLFGGSFFGGHVLQVDANARPRRVPTPHVVDEDVLRSKEGSDLWMSSLPAFEALHRIHLG